MTPTTPDLDCLLADALAPPERPADRAFLSRVELAITEHARFSRQWRALLWRGAGEVAAVLALLAGLVLLSRTPVLAPFVGHDWLPVASPLLLVLLLWAAVQRWRLA